MYPFNPTQQSALYPVPEGKVIAARYDGKAWHIRLSVRTETDYQESIVILDERDWKCSKCQRGIGKNCSRCLECSDCCECWYCAGCKTRHKCPWYVDDTETEYFQCKDCRHCEQSCVCWMITEYKHGTCLNYRRTALWARQAYKGKALCRDGIVRVFRLNNADCKTSNSRLGTDECTVQVRGKKIRGIIQVRNNVVKFIPFAESPHADVIKQRGKKEHIYKVRSLDDSFSYRVSL